MTQEEYMRDRIRRLTRAMQAHYEAANRLRDWESFSTSVAICSGVVLMIIPLYMSSEDRLPLWITENLGPVLFGAGLGSLLLSILSRARQWGERWKKHQPVGAEYAALRRRLETAMLAPPVPADLLTEIDRRMDELGRTSDLVPTAIWNRANTRSDREAKRRKKAGE